MPKTKANHNFIYNRIYDDHKPVCKPPKALIYQDKHDIMIIKIKP